MLDYLKKKNQSYKTLLASTESIYIFGAALKTISSEVWNSSMAQMAK